MSWWPFRISLLSAGLLAILATGASLAQKTPASPVLKIDELGKGLALIDGPWQFHLGDDPAFASPGLDDVTGHNGWEEILTNKSWSAQTHPGYDGFAWYRRHLHLTPAAGGPQEFAINVRQIRDVYEIYWNGVLIGRNGKMPPHWDFPNRDIYDMSSHTFGLGAPRDGVLAVRVWKAPRDTADVGDLAGFLLTPNVGSPSAIEDRTGLRSYRWLQASQLYFAAIGLHALVMTLSLIVWLRDRSQSVLLWMAVYSFPFVLNGLLVDPRLSFSYKTGTFWYQPQRSLQDIAVWFLLLYLLRLIENPRWMRFVPILAVSYLIANTLDGSLLFLYSSDPRIAHRLRTVDVVLTVIISIVQAFPFVLVCFAVRKRLDLARWLLAITVLVQEVVVEVSVDLAQLGWAAPYNKLYAPLGSITGSITAVDIMNGLFLIAILYAVYRSWLERLDRQNTLEQEYRSARELQQVLIPEALPLLPGYSLTSAYQPAQEVGGDFFQVLPLEGAFAGSTLVVLGDVSGKGLKAAMAVTLIVGTVRTLAEMTASPAIILAGLNRRLHGRLQGGFTTCIALRLDPEGRCVLSSAGHPGPFLNGDELDLEGELPLGLTLDASYTESDFELAIGDQLSLFTDGLLEARNPAGELYGFDRLHTLFASRPTAEQATQVAIAFGQDDDITVLTLTQVAAGTESNTQLSVPHPISA